MGLGCARGSAGQQENSQVGRVPICVPAVWVSGSRQQAEEGTDNRKDVRNSLCKECIAHIYIELDSLTSLFAGVFGEIL